ISAASWLRKNGTEVKGFINDFVTGSVYAGYKIIKSSELKGKFNIINCIIEGRSIEAKQNILKLKPSSQIDYFALQLAFPGDLIQLDFLSNTDSILEDADRYRRLYKDLEDEESKETLENIINFRLNREIDFLQNFKFRLKEQYFEPFVKLIEHSTFVDGGGFDGGTSKQFVAKYPGYESIYYFEPNDLSFKNSQENLNQIKKVKFFKKGLWDKSEVLYFDNTLGSASKISKTGRDSIETISLDELGIPKLSFMKLDIEGAECKALEGARKTIINNKPVLAVCVYHNQKDFLNVPDFVMSLHSDYRIYLRHYTQGVFETVMYFV
ncbi:MAG TPA: FkbM family methyltransferase, partial [Hanamia sp.]|nr:FkbM family methyltransferase [Hanamia sp.]